MIEVFREKFRKRHQLLQEIEAKNRKSLGWVCTYAPEEIIYAAGMVPIRILGGTMETPRADAYFSSNSCSFIRNCLEEGFQGKYDPLEGVVVCHTCDHIRRFYDIWNRYLKERTPFTYALNIPCKMELDLVGDFKRILEHFKASLEEFLGKEIPEEALKQAIRVYNETRSLLRKIYELRKADSPPITGSETLEVILAGMVMPKEEYNPLLKELLSKLERRAPRHEGKTRLLIVGSELESPEYIQRIEELGGLVVTDDLCNGTRYFWDPVAEEGDPMEALARRYLLRPPCPRMSPQSRRIAHLKEMIRAFRVEGVIYETIKFCDLHAGVYPVIKDGLAELGVPVLKLEREHLLAGSGQLSTRAQAFLESIHAEVA